MIKILVPLSLSDYALNALNYAIRLGQKFPSEVILVHCFPELFEEDEVVHSSGTVDKKNFLAVKKENERRTLEDLARKTEEGFNPEQKKNIQLKVLFLSGYPEDALVKLSMEINPDCIVMGTQSKGETIKELLGSITSDVIKKAKAPVLAIPAKSEINLEKISNVLFVTDFSETDYRSLHKLIRIITPFKTVIYCIHFCSSPPDKWEKEKQNEFKAYCESTYRNHSIEAETMYGERFLEALDLFIREKGIDLIAMTRRRRTLISSLLHPNITRKILFHTDIPLLVFHE